MITRCRENGWGSQVAQNFQKRLTSRLNLALKLILMPLHYGWSRELDFWELRPLRERGVISQTDVNLCNEKVHPALQINQILELTVGVLRFLKSNFRLKSHFWGVQHPPLKNVVQAPISLHMLMQLLLKPTCRPIVSWRNFVNMATCMNQMCKKCIHACCPLLSYQLN